jgi:endonuclease/exonuclease/phosphatase family metal-dependent hydrolase
MSGEPPRIGQLTGPQGKGVVMCHRTRVLSGLVLVVCFLSTAAVFAEQTIPASRDRQVTVLTWNTYLGADLGPALDPDLPQEELLQVIAQIWAEVQLTNFPERADAIARQIELVHPEILSLQEVVLWQTGEFLNPEPATTVAYDFLEILLEALESRGLSYAVVAVAHGFSAEVPNIATMEDLRFTDRQAILIRSDLRVADLKWSNARVGTYDARIPIDLLGQELSVTRTWISLDVKVRGKSFRLVSTQLEYFFPSVQVAQALELLSGPAGTEWPLVVVGDLNSPADGAGTPTYGLMLQAGFVDSWSELNPDDGFTCCQQGDLLNSASTLSERIDFVLFRGDFTPVLIDVLGEEQTDRTPTGLWPSDHAGVVTRLLFRK